MTDLQKIVKYIAIAFAALLAVGIIAGCVGLFGVLGAIVFGGKNGSTVISGSPDGVYTAMTDIKALEIDIGAANLTIRQGESFSVESNLKNLKISEGNGKLVLKEKSRFNIRLGKNDVPEAILTVYIPQGTVLNEADITTGAGSVRIEAMSADNLELELGAGDLMASRLTVTGGADIQGGAGRVALTDCSIRNLDMEMGVGQLNMHAALSGRSELDLGVGESNITLIGSKTDYSLDISKGIGEVIIEGKKVNDAGSYGGENRVSINGGIGRIDIGFESADN